jgi:hypothetical protein
MEILDKNSVLIDVLKKLDFSIDYSSDTPFPEIEKRN